MPFSNALKYSVTNAVASMRYFRIFFVMGLPDADRLGRDRRGLQAFRAAGVRHKGHPARRSTAGIWARLVAFVGGKECCYGHISFRDR